MDAWYAIGIVSFLLLIVPLGWLWFERWEAKRFGIEKEDAILSRNTVKDSPPIPTEMRGGPRGRISLVK